MGTSLLHFSVVTITLVSATLLFWRQSHPRRNVALLSVTSSVFGTGTSITLTL